MVNLDGKFRRLEFDARKPRTSLRDVVGEGYPNKTTFEMAQQSVLIDYACTQIAWLICENCGTTGAHSHQSTVAIECHHKGHHVDEPKASEENHPGQPVPITKNRNVELSIIERSFPHTFHG